MPQHQDPELLAKIAELQRKCWTGEKIAVELGVSLRTVERYLSRLNKRVFRQIEKNAFAYKAKQVRQLERIAEEAIAGWERSQQDAVTVKETESDDGDKTERTTKGQAGTPSFLAEARAALADVRKILGLDAPEQVTIGEMKEEPKRIDIPEDDDRSRPQPEGGCPAEAGPDLPDSPA